jgi:hypothetical protein
MLLYLSAYLLTPGIELANLFTYKRASVLCSKRVSDSEHLLCVTYDPSHFLDIMLIPLSTQLSGEHYSHNYLSTSTATGAYITIYLSPLSYN